ncbi:MAG: MgtC/SapB family protein [Candidatus Aenigmarchaeota archaeon]|nr:MgtC/SapB family protein [Candidatus Aenigmarchaeota archaeon]
MWQISSLEVDIATKLIVSAILGMIVGLDREIRGKPAGLRTHILVCVGAALFTIVSLVIEGGLDTRIASGIVTGIGFLGAGMIFHAENKVSGLTTAAEVWVLGAIGIAVGYGLYFAAIVATIIVIFVLKPGKLLEKRMDEKFRKKRR